MRNRLLLGLASLIVCGANAALAQRQEARSQFACADFSCEVKSTCTNIGCSDCLPTPASGHACA